ncbi:MAG: hypothetical protein F6K28_27805 [Microcoleus sp. SIO2G3]|nr:hypothetical protein [Microcoleus sp. SIO2G3]
MNCRRVANQILRSETLLVVTMLGVNFAAFPVQVATRWPNTLISIPVWAALFLATAAIGLWAIARQSATLWRLFCALSLFHLVTLTVSCILSGAVTGTSTYGILAYTAWLRMIGIPSTTLFGARRPG